MNKLTLLFHSPLKTAQKSIKQSRHTGAFPDHITPLCLSAPQHHVSTAPRPHCDINLPQNTGLINLLKGSSLSGPMNYRVWLKSKTAAHFQHSDLISARRWVDKYCSWATVGWIQMKSWDNLWRRLSVGFHSLVGKNVILTWKGLCRWMQPTKPKTKEKFLLTIQCTIEWEHAWCGNTEAMTNGECTCVCSQLQYIL